MSSQSLPFQPMRRSAPAARQAPAKRARVAGVVTLAGSELCIRFSGKSHPFINAVKTVRGFRYDRDSNRWYVHVGNIRKVRVLAAEHGWVLSQAVKNLPGIDAEEFPLVLSAEGDQLVVNGAFHPEAWAVLKNADGRHETKTGRWFIPNERVVDAVLDLRQVCKIKFDADSDLSAQILESVRMLALSRQLVPSEGWELVPSVARELRDFQHPGVEYLTASRRCFGWATMGAGKTTVALAALEHLTEAVGVDCFPALVIPPSGLKTNWVRETKAVLPHRSTFVCEGRVAQLPLETPDLFILNYDVVGRPDQSRSWCTALLDLGIRSLIIDEGHRCINLRTNRSKGILALSEQMEPDAARFLLTGTPVRNKRVEVEPQLRIIGRAGEFGDKKQIKADERLSRRLRTVCAWRPDPDEVLKALGVLNEDGTAEIVPNVVYVDGDPEIMAQYRKAEDDIIEFLRTRAMEKAVRLGLDPQAAAVEAEMKAGAAEQLMVINTLCRLAGQAKIKAAKEWVSDFLTTGEKLLVFAENTDMVRALSGAVDPAIPFIDGSVKHGARSVLCDRFQQEDNIAEADYLQALVLQIDAAGEGLTLTEAHNVLHSQLCWVPGQHDQADARAAWRMNNPHNIVSNYLVCVDTIDEYRMDVLATKRAEMRVVTDGDRSTMAQTSTYGDVFAKLLGKALGKDM